MGTGYTRNDTANNIADGNIINASDLDGEFDAVQSAFNASTGHTHDGTTGEGAPIEVIGPTQDVVATASVLRPKTDNTVDLGTTTLEYKDLFLDGTAHIDTLDVDENASITGTLGVTGAATLSSTLGVTGAATLSSTLGVTGATTLSSTLGVTGAATLSSTLAVTGAAGIDGDFDINTNKFTVASATGNTVVAGTLGVTGATTATGGLNVDTISEITSANGVVIDGVTLKDGGATVTADINFGDNDKAIFGAGSDLQIYHDGTHSYIKDNGTGNLLIQGSAAIVLEDPDGNNMIYAEDGGPVYLYSNGSQKLATTSTGIDVTGTVTADGLTVDGEGIVSSTTTATDLSNPILQLSGSSYTANGVYGIGFHYDTDASGTSPVFAGYQLTSGGGNTKGNLVFGTRDTTTAGDVPLIRQTIASNGDISFYDGSGNAKFFWDASAESLGIGTSSPGVKFVVANGSDADVSTQIFGADTTSEYLGFGQNGSNSVITAGSAGAQSVSLVFRTATSGAETERMRIDSSGNVGIGTSSPLRTLDVEAPAGSIEINSTAGGANLYLTSATGNLSRIRWNSASGSFAIRDDSNSSDRLVINSSGNVGIGTSSPATNLHIQSTSEPAITLYHTAVMVSQIGLDSTGSLTFGIDGSNGGTERMRIDSSGNLLVGTTDNTLFNNGAGGNQGVMLGSAANIQVAKSGAPAMYLNRLDSDGEIQRFSKNGTTVGSIGTRNGDLTVGTGGVGLQFEDSTNTIDPVSLSTNAKTDGVVNLGESSARFKNLYLSGGVYLGGTGAANHLDDYEEGTFTPTYFGASTAGTTTYTAQTGTYTKVGNKVTLQFYLEITNATGTGNSQFGGFPFATVSGHSFIGTVMSNNYNYSSSTGWVNFYMAANSAGDGRLYLNSDAASWVRQGMDTSFNIYVNITYMTA